MKTHRWTFVIPISAALVALSLLAKVVGAHCDGMDGPVVLAAQQALQGGDPAGALVWVRKEDEPEVLSAFRQALAVRGLSPEAKALADKHFMETLVRLHRRGEGEPYDGLQPSGRDLGPAIPAVDEALETGDVDPLVELLTARVARGLRERFDAARALQAYPREDVGAGRRFVEAYVALVHYAEANYALASAPLGGEGHGGHADHERAR